MQKNLKFSTRVGMIVARSIKSNETSRVVHNIKSQQIIYSFESEGWLIS